jgi:hypothetical protein
MKRLSLILTLCSLWGIPGTLFAQDTTTGVVRGQILEASQTEPPLEEVRVVIVSDDGHKHEAKTDSSGEFKISGLAPGRYLVNIYKQGYGPREGKRLTVLAGGEQHIALKMTKNKTPIAVLLIGFGIILLLCLIIVAVIVGRQIDRPSN